jgi:Kef-type K+ transport system membrane component KefB
VESLAQLGVQLLLFHLGRELSFAKLRAVWSVALVGGMLQIVALSALGGIIAAVMESPVTQVRACACACACARMCMCVWCSSSSCCCRRCGRRGCCTPALQAAV